MSTSPQDIVPLDDDDTQALKRMFQYLSDVPYQNLLFREVSLEWMPDSDFATNQRIFSDAAKDILGSNPGLGQPVLEFKRERFVAAALSVVFLNEFFHEEARLEQSLLDKLRVLYHDSVNNPAQPIVI